MLASYKYINIVMRFRCTHNFGAKSPSFNWLLTLMNVRDVGCIFSHRLLHLHFTALDNSSDGNWSYSVIAVMGSTKKWQRVL